MVNGVPSQLQYSSPWPSVFVKGEGARIWDLDGNEYYDFHLNYTVGVLGHDHPALRGQFDGLVHTGSLVEDAIYLSEIVCHRYNLDKVQWTNSGTEATLLAVHISRGYTGKPVIVKMEGGYHGVHDAVMASTHPALTEVGPSERPNLVPWGRGTQPDHTRVVSYNDTTSLENALAQGDVAGVILEPVMYNIGCVMPDEGYLASVRKLCDDYGALLIYDEVKTGLTVSWSGAQGVWPVKPDLLVLGKGIGGGLPSGCVGGPDEIMRAIGEVPHYSTFAGNPWSMRSGLLTMRALDKESWSLAEVLAQRLRSESQILLDKYNAGAYSAGIGLKGTIVWQPQRVRDYRQWEATLNMQRTNNYLRWMREHGILLSPGVDEQWTVSTQHTEESVDAYLTALEGYLKHE
jgi:glutamate-1-semialdehyde 2,1-aminomutase